jgi:hypothetical protein
MARASASSGPAPTTAAATKPHTQSPARLVRAGHRVLSERHHEVACLMALRHPAPRPTSRVAVTRHEPLSAPLRVCPIGPTSRPGIGRAVAKAVHPKADVSSAGQDGENASVQTLDQRHIPDIRLDRCVGLDWIDTVRKRGCQSPQNFDCSREGLGAIARL